MDNLFLQVLNMSITAGWLVLAVILLRLLLKKCPKWTMGILWALVAVRLVCPISIESVFSLIPSQETIPSDILTTNTPAIDSGIPSLNQTINPLISDSLAPEVGASVNPTQVLTFVASYIWIIGMILMLLYVVFTYCRVAGKVREAVHLQGKVWLSDQIETPFILGLFAPKIYLPLGLAGEDMEYVIAHEKAHLTRGDHLWKPFGFLLLTIYWFHPLMWAAYILLCRDIELACDEKVIRKLGEKEKTSYSTALINCSIPKKFITACPLAFGETAVKTRIKTVLNYKKPAFWVLLVSIFVCLTVALCFLTNPKSTYLKDLCTLDDMMEVYVGDGFHQDQTTGDVEEITDFLENLLLSGKPVSKSRAEDRDKTHTLLLKNESHAENGGHGLFLHFSKDYKTLWIHDGVKPSFSYEVKSYDAVREIYQKLQEKIVTAESEEPEDPKDSVPEGPPTMEDLRTKYESYFNLDLQDNLYICAWETVQDSYQFVLTTQESVMADPYKLALRPRITGEEMQMILSTYNLEERDIAVTYCTVPQVTYNSSYILTDLNGRPYKTASYEEEAYDSWGIRSEVLFSDDNKVTATFQREIYPSAVRGGNAIMTSEFSVKVQHEDEILTLEDYMKNILHREYTVNEPVWPEDTYQLNDELHPYPVTLTYDIAAIYGELPPGTYLLCVPITLKDINGFTLDKEYVIPFVVVD